jgi:hypothetical protein
MRILMILMPDSSDKPTLKIRQVIEPYYLFRDSGAEVVVASLAGGGPVSTAAGHDPAAAVQRLRSDDLARELLADTLSLDQVSANDFQAAFCIGTVEELEADTEHPASLLIARLLDAGKPVAVLSESRGVRLLISGNASRPAAQALLGALSDASSGITSGRTRSDIA